MNRKRILGLILFGSLTIFALLIGVKAMIGQGAKSGPDQNQSKTAQQEATDQNTAESDTPNPTNDTVDIAKAEPWLSSNPSDTGDNSQAETNNTTGQTAQAGENETEAPSQTQTAAEVTPKVTPTPENAQQNADNAVSAQNQGNINTSGETEDVLGTAVNTTSDLQLIYDSSQVDYMSYIPDMVMDNQMKTALDINNPDISIDAKAAILIDADTKEVLFYKNAVEPVFPASTAKLLNALVTLDWCSEDEQITIGDEIKMIPTDATRAYLNEGQVLTLRNLLEGMLLPSGNDAAFAAAVYVGRKSLKNPKATKEEAIKEFTRLMNQKAKDVGTKNSCFKSPDGYDALGQYTTAYDMGMIGLAAIKNETIQSISKKSKSRNVFVSGEDVTWNSTNSLINKDSGKYYSYAIGLKTGTSTMAGKCLIAAARKDGKEVVCAIMDSTSSGRWDDATALLKYGLK